MNTKNWVIFTVICVGLIFYNMLCFEMKDLAQEERYRVRIAKAIELAPKIARLERQLITDFTTSDLKKLNEKWEANNKIYEKIEALRNR